MLRVKFTWPQEADHITRHDPARVLAEVAAKRVILDLYIKVACGSYDDPTFAHGRVTGLSEALRLLTAAYAAHPDYRPELWP